MTSPLPSPAKIGAVILAAGASQRLGQPKQLVSVSGKPMLARTIEAALAIPRLWPVVVVLGARAEQIRPVVVPHPVLIVENAAWAEGMASSLRLGLTTVEAFQHHIPAVLFTLCDQPGLTPATLHELVETYDRSHASLVAARYDGHLGAPALLRREHFAHLHQLVGDEGARQLFARVPSEQIASIERPELAFDLDTPGDLARLHASS